MKRFIAFLRGINISGKNKIPMAELKKAFEELGFKEVKTYLNSGNVIFSSNEDNTGNLTTRIEARIKEKFCFDIPIFIISKEDLEDILQHAPDWWPKTASASISGKLTIRTANTVRKVVRSPGFP